MTVPHILTKICVKLIGHRRSRQTNRLKVMPQLMIQSQKDKSWRNWQAKQKPLCKQLIIPFIPSSFLSYCYIYRFEIHLHAGMEATFILIHGYNIYI